MYRKYCEVEEQIMGFLIILAIVCCVKGIGVGSLFTAIGIYLVLWFILNLIS